MPTINLPRPRPLVSSPIASREGYPNAVACLRDDLDELLTCFRYKSEEQRRRYEPPTPSNDASAKSGDGLGPWAPSRTKPSMDRILFAVFSHENKSQSVSTPFLLTQTIDVTGRASGNWQY